MYLVNSIWILADTAFSHFVLAPLKKSWIHTSLQYVPLSLAFHIGQ